MIAKRTSRLTLGALCLGFSLFAHGADPVSAPAFEVDPYWPKPLPNHWILGSAIGVGVDSRDHVFVIHRRNSFNERTEIGAATDPKTGTCCIPAPNILEFDPDGNLVNSWGGPNEGYTWPVSNHGLTVDHKDNIWIGGNGRGDSHILKFTRDGRFLQQIGIPGNDPDSLTTEHFGRVAKISFYAGSQRGLRGRRLRNKRVVVLDADTGEFKRFWGAYGNSPTIPISAATIRAPHRRSSFAIRCTAPNRRATDWCTSAIVPTTASRCSAPTALRDGDLHRTDDAGGWLSVGHRVLRDETSSASSYLADGKNMKVWIIERSRWRS
jgi:hypothetical protein